MSTNVQSWSPEGSAACLPMFPEPTSAWPRGREVLILLGILTLFLLVNLATASRSPTVWQDEVQLTDPAANLHFGHGFTSTAFEDCSRNEIVAGSGTPYSLLVYGWIRMFGFSPGAVRSLNYLLVICSSLLLWVAVCRWRLIVSPWMRLLLILVVLCDYAISFSYRSGRYDMLGFVAASAAFAAATIPKVWVRWLVVAALCALIPAIGIQNLVYTGIMLLLLFAFFGRGILPLLVSAGIGVLAGAAGLFVVCKALGLWDNYWNSLVPCIVIDRATPTLKNILEAEIYKLTHQQSAAYLGDYSANLLMACLLLLGIRLLWSRRLCFRSPVGFGFATVLGLGFILGGVLRHYPYYYMWMGSVPLGICTLMTIEQVHRDAAPRKLLAICGALILVACCIGLPFRMLVVSLEWRQRDYAQVETFVTRNISSTDWVYCDYPAYYPVKRTSAMMFLPPYRRQLSNEDKVRISVLVIDPDDMPPAVKDIGGKWEATGAALDVGAAQKNKTPWYRILGGAKMYRLTVYRRSPEGSPQGGH